MSTLPEVKGVGTLTADPELRFTPAGLAVANVNIAFNSRRLNKQTEQWEDGDTTFLRGSIWKEYAENVAESLSKGDKVFVVGNLKQRKFTDKEGVERTVFELDIQEIGPALRFATANVTRATKGAGRAAPQQQSNDWGNDEPGWG